MQGGVIMLRSSAYSAAIVCGLKRRLRARVEHAHSEIASIRKLNAANTRSSCLPSICGTRACRPRAQATSRFGSEQAPVVLADLTDRATGTATRGSQVQVRCGRASSARRRYRHSRRQTGGDRHWLLRHHITAPGNLMNARRIHRVRGVYEMNSVRSSA
jgi:hypothetical protein